ncbi:PEGA domain-containing protein [Anaerocolumna sp.]|uniref:PEGA domain-containing protein n=1 Tax=Anaerocolumna sp. TaxID=2041569 RepID=UPI0028A88BBA|nr:PEGA domain-containing protein [Anaerocolumna sp.]
MDNNYFNEKTKGNIDKGFPIILGIACFIIVVATIMAISKGQGKGNAKTLFSTSKDTNVEEQTGSLEFDKQIIGVLKEINRENNSITFFDVKKKEDIVTNYTSGTIIYDKYEQAMVLEQLKLGELVEVYYNSDNSELVKLQISNQAWEYKNANNWGIDTINKIFTIGDNKYKYGRNISILSNDTFLKPEDLHEKDLLTIKGLDREIFSIQITKGHGTITFEEYEDFVGGIVFVGNDSILPITENMVVTVREGEYEVTLENGSLAGTKTARVKRDENVLLNMSEYRKPAVKSGLVSFEILPEGAELYLDDVIQSYDEPIKLEYGKYMAKVILKGYETYENTIIVDEASKTIAIELEVPLDDLDDSGSYNSDQTDNANGEENNNEEIPDKSSSQGGKQISGQLIYILEPEGASVYLDGELKGIAPVSFPKITGNHYITLIKNGYETKTYTIEATNDGEDTYFNFPEMLKSQ